VATTVDLIVIAAYLFITLIIGLIASKREHLEGYMINNRRTHLFLLTTSNIATQIGAGAIVGVAASAYLKGVSYGIIVMISIFLSFVLFSYIAPRIKAFGDKHKAYTTGDFFEHRFGRNSRYVFAGIYILLAFLWSGVQFVAIAQLIKILTGINFEVALIGAAVITIIYTSVAGIISDLLTDFFQFWVMVLTFIVLVPLAWGKAGGMDALTALPATYFDPLAFGGIIFFLGGIFLSGLVVLPEVHFWQRIYSADSEKTARRSFIWALPSLLFVAVAIICGLLAVKLAPNVEPDLALFSLMNNVLPSGLLGLGYAGIIAIVMSSIDSILLGGSATILKDFYMPIFHPERHEHELLNMARYITAIFGILSAVVAFYFQDIVNLTILASFTAGCFSFAILGGLFWKRTTAKACIASMISSLIVLYISYPFLKEIAFVPSFFAAVAVLVIVSLLTEHSKSEHFI
jgi:SSS family solute:Na+ symporter